MTVEIKQLIIRAVVESRHDPVGAAEASTPGRAPPEDRQALVAACVREVLRQLERSRDR